MTAMNTRVLVEVTNLATRGALALTINWMRELFDEFRVPTPPLPENVLTLVPCSLLVTETQGKGGLRTGKIKLTDPHGGVLYENEWSISAARS
jgi:hypothetical protein